MTGPTDKYFDWPDFHQCYDQPTMEEVARQIEEADLGLSDMEELPEVGP